MLTRWILIQWCTQWSFRDQFTRLILSYSSVRTLFMCFAYLMNVWFSCLCCQMPISCADMTIKYCILNIFATSRDNQSSISWDFFTQSQKYQAKRKVIEATNELGFILQGLRTCANRCNANPPSDCWDITVRSKEVDEPEADTVLVCGWESSW